MRSAGNRRRRSPARRRRRPGDLEFAGPRSETAAFFERQITIDDRSIELVYGEYEGVPAGEVPRRCGSRGRRDSMFATKVVRASVRSTRRYVQRARNWRTHPRSRHRRGESRLAIKAAVASALNTTTVRHVPLPPVAGQPVPVDMGKFGPLLHSFNGRRAVPDFFVHQIHRELTEFHTVVNPTEPHPCRRGRPAAAPLRSR